MDTQDMKRFLNRIRILYNIDAHEIDGAMEAAGCRILTSEDWQAFRDNPVRFLIRADGPTQRALWSIVQRRDSPRRAAEANAEAERLRDEKADADYLDPDRLREDREADRMDAM